MAQALKPVLDYPFAEPPADGATLEVAPGVHWIRMPMGATLTHINLWAVDEGSGWAVVDSGLHNERAVEVWRAVAAGGLQGRPVTRVLVTHMHPDHVGMAGWLAREFGCPLWMSALEYMSCRVMVADTGQSAPPESIEFYRAAGWDDAAIAAYRSRFGRFGRSVEALPQSFHRLYDGQRLTLGSHEWRVVVGSGHSPEHACLYCPELKLFISGDQVLPRISSNVSVFPTEPRADPLARWLESIEKIKREVPDDVLVLPAHNEPFHGLHARLDYLASGHHAGLDRLRAVLSQPRRAVDVFGSLFARTITAEPMLLGLATGESIAHLNYLLARGEIDARRDAAGVDWYRLAGAA